MIGNVNKIKGIGMRTYLLLANSADLAIVWACPEIA